MVYDSYIMRRTQIYLDEDQRRELTRRARRQGVTSSHLIREALGEYLAQHDDQSEELASFQAAVDASFGIAPHLPSGADYVKEMRHSDALRQAELERRWRG
jgi:Arc/MetJ-type ribon-helix-helix transcriptional regulator